jgi:hypothetical protein
MEIMLKEAAVYCFQSTIQVLKYILENLELTHPASGVRNELRIYGIWGRIT